MSAKETTSVTAAMAPKSAGVSTRASSRAASGAVRRAQISASVDQPAALLIFR